MARKFTRAQRQAYQSGKGYAVAMAKKGINFKDDSLKDSFREGFKQGNRIMAKNPLKYPPLPKKRSTRTTKKKG